MTKEQLYVKWLMTPDLKADIEAVIANEIAKVKEQPQPSDKVQISKHTLVEVNRAFRALKRDTESYIHKVFGDDGVFDAMKEISEAYKYYFGEYPTEQIPSAPAEQTAKPFDKDRFEAMFRAVVASGVVNGITYDESILQTKLYLTQLDAFYAEKGGNNG